jgi:hypothetical protein
MDTTSGAPYPGVLAIDAPLYDPLPTAFIASTLPMYEVPFDKLFHVFERLVNSGFGEENVSAVDQDEPPFEEY